MNSDLLVWTFQMLAVAGLLAAVWAVGAQQIVKAAKPVQQVVIKNPVGFMPPPA
jgi:hypothetical protein